MASLWYIFFSQRRITYGLWPVRLGHRRGWALENGMKGVAMWASGGSQSTEIYLLDWSSRCWEYLDEALWIDVGGFHPNHAYLKDFSKNLSHTANLMILYHHWRIAWPPRWRAGISSGYGVLTSDGASRSYRHQQLESGGIGSWHRGQYLTMSSVMSSNPKGANSLMPRSMVSASVGKK